MEKVDTIITGRWLVCSADMTPIRNGAVAIRSNKIIQCGTSEAVSERFTASKLMSRPDGIITPGLFNTHTHLPMTLFRGLADDLPLKIWLEEHIFPAEAGLTPDLIKLGAKLACVEMIRSGVTSFMDVYMFEDLIAEVADQIGLRAWVGEGLFDFPSPAFNSGFDALKETERMMNKWKGHDRITVTVNPHTPYTCSTELLSAAYRLASKHDAITHIHVAETTWEDAEIKKRHGVSPVLFLDRLGFLDNKTLMAHCVTVSEKDMEVMSKYEVSVSHCPESNLKLASGIAPIPAMMQHSGINITIGTDGAASNNDLDLLGEMDSAAKIHKGTSGRPEILSADEIFKMVTSGGAVAAGRDDLGVLKEGALADLAVFNLNVPHMRPCLNPISQIVYSARGGDVTDLLVNGSIIMENSKISVIDETELFEQVESAAIKAHLPL